MAEKRISGFDPRFLDAASDWARTNGKLEGDPLGTYFRTSLRCVNSEWYQKLATKLAAETPSDPKVVAVGQNNSVALLPIHFVYMDVGCWAGDGGAGWTRHREFGVAYGHIVVLCSFGVDLAYYRQLNPPKWVNLRDTP